MSIQKDYNFLEQENPESSRRDVKLGKSWSMAYTLKHAHCTRLTRARFPTLRLLSSVGYCAVWLALFSLIMYSPFYHWIYTGTRTGSLNYYRANISAMNFLCTVTRPTLIIWGMKDKYLSPILLNGLEKLVSDLKISKVEDAAHWVHQNQSRKVNQLILQYLQTHHQWLLFSFPLAC